MADEFECPDCRSLIIGIPDRCPCGWVNPDVDERRNQSSVREAEHIMDSMPDVRARAIKQVEEAKKKYGENWQEKYLEDLTKQMRHSALLARREARRAAKLKLEKFRKYSGKHDYLLREDLFNAHVAELEAEGKKVKVINDHNKGME